MRKGFFFQAEDGIRNIGVTGVQTCALPIYNLINKKENKDGYTHEKIKSLNYSCSTFIIYLVLRRKYKNLKVHNIYIGKNFRENIQAPFIGSIPKDQIGRASCRERV